MKKVLLFSISLLMLFGLTNCGTGSAPTSEPQSLVLETAVSPTNTPTATAIPTATASPNPPPTQTPQPSPTSEPTATVTIDVNNLQIIENRKLNLNNTTQYALLETIPNLDQQLAIEFFENQPYSSIKQFRQAIGPLVEPSELRSFEQYIYVPIDVNEADVATLMQIPRLSEEVARTVIEKRPFASNTDFLKALIPYLTESQLRIAGGFLRR